MEKVTETVVIVGASSEIAGRIAINLACNRDFVLLARQSERLTTRGGLVSVLKELGARSVEVREFNATDFT
ncbi:KR domain-containing protein [Corynebacterium diphtheriae]|nr:KR domain-containing protein [Corynebacterium diphtheriae]